MGQLGRRSLRPEYDVRDLLKLVLDDAPFDEYKADYGQTLVCGFGRLGGMPVGVVANQKKRVKPADGPMQFGGVIYVDSADKAARFIMDCNQTPRPDPVPAGRERLHGRARIPSRRASSRPGRSW